MVYEPDNTFDLADNLGDSPNNLYFSGQSLTFGDDDFAYFYAYAGETITINTYSFYDYSDYVDTTISLYQGIGGPLVAFDDDGGVGLDSSLSYYVTTSGNYYFNVSGYTDFSTGVYNLTVNAA